MMFVIAVTLSLLGGCSGVAVLLPYKDGVATDLTGAFLGASGTPSTRSVFRSLTAPIRFYGEDFSSVTIFESGVVILQASAPLSACPSPLSSQAEQNYRYISAYWRRAVVNFLNKGRIFFQEKNYNPATDSKILSDIQTAFAADVVNEGSFVPTRLHIFTWDGVGSFDEGLLTGRNTFQLVIASDSSKSFGIFLFNDIQYYAEQDQESNFCPRPAKVGIRSKQLTYWISNEVQRLEQAKRINVFSNIKLYDSNFLGRYCLRFFGVRSCSDPSQACMFPRPAPALHQNCEPPFNVHPVCQANVPDTFCIGKTGILRHPNLCSMFVFCDWDQVRGVRSCPGPGSNSECPEGMSWNAHVRFCSCDNAQNCQTTAFSEVAVVRQAGTTLSPEVRTPNPAVDVDCEYYPNGNYINFEDCDSYWSCSNKRSIRMRCPSGLLWNPRRRNGGYGGYCDYPSNVDCSRREFRQSEIFL